MNETHPLAQTNALLQKWSRTRGGDEQHWPVLIPAATLRRAGYYESFPQLLMTAAFCESPETDPEALSPSAWCLSPAVCYHAYAALEGRTLTNGVKLGARGHCFRNEARDQLSPGRRQIEFQMRELILIGAPEWIEAELARIPDEIEQLATTRGLHGAWQAAGDPFFLPKAQGKAHMQRLLKTKSEFCLGGGLAIASINRHGAFFGERFSIALPDAQPAHSACIAFGLDRWASNTKPDSSHDRYL